MIQGYVMLKLNNQFLTQDGVKDASGWETLDGACEYSGSFLISDNRMLVDFLLLITSHELIYMKFGKY